MTACYQVNIQSHYAQFTGYIAFVIKTLLQGNWTSDDDADNKDNKASPSSKSPIGLGTSRQKLGEHTGIDARFVYVKENVQLHRSWRQTSGPKA